MTIVIVGLGVIGGSFAMGLRNAGYDTIYGVDTHQETVKEAKDQVVITDGFIDAKMILPQADVVILSLYPSQIAPFIQEHKQYFKEGAILTDVTGVKTSVIKEVFPILPKTIDFIFAHPMRGSEKRGFVGADSSRFVGANALITPISSNQEKNIQLVEKLYADIGFSVVTRVSPELHDQQIAYVSQLMHALAVSVVNSSDASKDTLTFAGNSFQELTRIAQINESLWSELFLHNADSLLESIESFETELGNIKHALQTKDEETLKSIFKASTEQRQEWF